MPISEVEFIYSPVINFAMQQNHVPVIRKISLKNSSDIDLENISFEIQSDPDFAVVWTHMIDFIKKDESFELSPIQLNISSKYLAELTERIAGSFTMAIKTGGEIIYKENYKVDLLAYDQWNGISILPELLSTFITPNHPQIPTILKRASVILGQWTGDPSFNAYQARNPDRVRKQMAAIYESIAELQIVYCSVPASFEETGQRIRMCDTVLSTQMGNCLDLSLLYASCLEAVGINPLIMIVKGHAFAGAWLIDESFADAVNDDSSEITKRTADGINEIALVEATCMNAGPKSSFEDAVASANFKMVDEKDFILFIDIKRARFSRIRPLPLRIKTLNGWEIKEEQVLQRENEIPDDITAGTTLLNVDKIEVSRQKLWERKLLDLTLRNNLLNLRITKSAIQFIGINLSKLEDSLADGNELQILSKPTDWDNPLRSAGVYQAVNQSDPVIDLVKQEFTQKRIRAYQTEAELNYGIISLFRASRLSIEENGANTLYIALGLLKWYETEASERPRYAPVLLIPVELIKKSAVKGFVIRSREEETMINITLLEMLRHDFGINIGGLENLPKDDSGVDVKAIFNIIRQSIMNKKGWDIEEQSFLSTFSFSKFILWNDIHNNADKLCKNKIVSSLVTGKLEWETNVELQNPENINPADISLPISTDSSQLQAVISSVSNQSFVLHGPPGTGKSQTITNIIANALYQGKKVLFVSAKKAALEVVQVRLNAIGLGPFCLELHSNKSKKSEVLAQIKKAMEVTKKNSVQNFQSEANRLFSLRSELNGYITALHKKYPFGYSLFDLFSRYSELKKDTARVYFSQTDIDKLDENTLIIWNDIIEELQAIGVIIMHPHNHPLEALHLSQYSQQLKAESRQEIVAYLNLVNEYNELLPAIADILKLEKIPLTRPDTEKLKNIEESLLSLPDTPSRLFGIEHAEQNLTRFISLAKHGIRRNELRDELLQNFNKNILILDADQLLSDWNLADHKWFLSKFLKQKTIIKKLKTLSANGTIDKKNIPVYLQDVIDYKSEQEIINKEADFQQNLGFLWENGEGDWNRIIAICNSIIDINREAQLLNDSSEGIKWRNNLSTQFHDGSKLYIDKHRSSLMKLNSLFSEIKNKENVLQQLLQTDFSKLKGIDDNWIKSTVTYANRWVENIDQLKGWVSWNQTKEKAIKTGLLSVISVYENGGFDSTEIITEYKRGLYKSCADYIMDHESALASFNGKLFEEKIRKFREVTALFEQLTREELFAKLASRMPSFTQEAAQSSEIGMLQRTIKNNGRAMSIRKLFDAIPNLLPRLTPCMLMSPISVAQYFDTESEKFDLLVFDEASQLPTCEAVSAIARAANVIVVGDPKQMPPTNFFSTNNIDEENIEREDLESILDDCLALSMPSHHLLWHYRSKHESLIAFSNAKYYDNKLLTFPSPDDIISKVSFINIEGHYEKKGRNSFEAKAIVDEVVRRLSDVKMAKKSIGIITFSMVQQILIEDLLNEVFKSRPDIEKIATESQEPLFIKNLENVQGDERDVILFSIGYGPDKEGKVSLNFGPVNREGGWRRLNVAVSRARYEMKVFSTLRADQIDLARTSSEGVAGLKAFLAYAEKGKTALPNRVINKSMKQAAFENMLAEEIKQNGYDVHVDIGCSAYKIDIGIVDPAKSSEYLLGILCDGNNYSRDTTARDREIVQPEILKALGWNIYKVWSVDWWENPGRVLNEVINAIKNAEEKRNVIEEIPEIKIPHYEKPLEEVLNNSYNNIQPEILQNKKAETTQYNVCNLEIALCSTSEDFFWNINRKKITDQILNVLETESPVSYNLLCKRVLSAWGISRNGTRLNNYLGQLFSELNIPKEIHNQNIFFWKKEHNPKEYFIYRRAKNDLEKRNAEDLPPEEIANAVKEILKNQISLSRTDLIRETAKLFDFSRTGSNVENAMNLGINLILQKGNAMEENGRIILKEN